MNNKPQLDYLVLLIFIILIVSRWNEFSVISLSLMTTVSLDDIDGKFIEIIKKLNRSYQQRKLLQYIRQRGKERDE